MGNLYLGRHGETDWNLKKLYQGAGLDIPLNERGLLDAEGLRDTLSGVHIDLIVTSPALRARQTAAPISLSKGIPLLTLHGLRERDHGKNLVGASYEGVKDVHQYLYTEAADEGETLVQTRERAGRMRRPLLALANNLDVLVISHAFFLSTAVLALEELPLRYDPTLFLQNAHFHQYQVKEGRVQRLGLNLKKPL